MSRYDLTDLEWRVIEPLLPNKPRGVPRVDDRRTLNGIFWVLRSGAPRRDLPERYGPRTTCYNRFVRWRKAGVWHPADGRHHRRPRRRHPDDRQHLCSRPPAGCDGKKGGQVTVSDDHAAGSRPRSTSSFARKAARSGSARSQGKRTTVKLPTRCSTISAPAPSCWRTRLTMPTASAS